MNRALFLDRDGTINVDAGYVCRKEEFELIPGVLDLAREAARRGYLLIVCTNQSGIARGYYTEEDYRQLTAHMEALFEAEGCPLTAVYHCPLLEGSFRKPAPGMFLQAIREHDIDPNASLSLGDKERDVLAARAAGVSRNYLLSDAPLLPSSLATAAVASPRELLTLL